MSLIKRHGFGYCQIGNKWFIVGGSNEYNDYNTLISPTDNNIFNNAFHTSWLKDCLMSVDNGITWTVRSNDIFSDNNVDNLIGVYLPTLFYNNDDNILYFCGGHYSNNIFRKGFKYIWKSHDMGINWIKLIVSDSFFRELGYFPFYNDNLKRVFFYGGVNINSETNVYELGTRSLRQTISDSIYKIDEDESNQIFTTLIKFFNPRDNNNDLTPSYFTSGVFINDLFNGTKRNFLILFGGYFITSNLSNTNSRRQTIIYDFENDTEKSIHTNNNIYNNTTHLELDTQFYSKLIYHPNSRLLILLTGFYANNYNTLYTANIDDLIYYYDNDIFDTGIIWRKQFGLTDNNGLPSSYGILKNAGLFIDDNNLYIYAGLKSKINFDETQFNLVNNQLQNLEIEVSSETIKISIKQINNLYTKSKIILNDNQNININDESTSFALSTIGLNRTNGLFLEYQLVQDYLLNTRYFGKDNLIEYLVGNMPLILTVTHGGFKNLTYINDRSQTNLSDSIVLGTDNFTYQLALNLRKKIYHLTNKYPHVILGCLTRSKCDLNRYIYQTENGKSYAVEDKDMSTAWWEFYNFINIAINNNNSFILDIHGHGLENNDYTITTNIESQIVKGDFIHLGYLLNNNDLNNIFQNNTNILFSAQKYQNDLNITQKDFIFGNNSFGNILNKYNLNCYPSNNYRLITSNSTYFSGGNITKVFGSNWKFNPDINQNSNVIQMEFPMVYRTIVNRDEISSKVALSIIEFLSSFI